ncbi:MAG: YbaB/EbfC family nucleoid-associated protein [Caldisericia bacterium]
MQKLRSKIMGQMDMIKQAMAMRSQMKVIDKKLQNMRIEEEIGHGDQTVKVIANGRMEIIGLSISDEAMNMPNDKLAKLILQTVTKAQSEAKNSAAKIARDLQLG